MNYVSVLDDIFKNFNGPLFGIQLAGNKEKLYGKGTKKKFTLVFDNAQTVKRLLSGGSLGFGESYMNGSIQIKGNIEDYLKLRHEFRHVKPTLRLFGAKLHASLLKNGDRQKQISYHYDLGNDFFSMILDKKTMSYSAGLYENKGTSLENAQQQKIEWIAKWLALPRSAEILDLGFGWGGFAKFASEKYKWNITGLTLSRKQLDYATKLIKKEKLERNVQFKYKDMLEVPKKKYDGIVVIESIEHVGKEKLSYFIRNLKEALKPGAPLYIQTTGRYRPKPVDKWTLKYVFPGGYLPAQEELFSAVHDAGLFLEEFRDDTDDYILTMSEWIKNLESHKSDIEKMFDASFYNLWYLWMHGAKVAFETHSMGLFRLKLRKGTK